MIKFIFARIIKHISKVLFISTLFIQDTFENMY
jgi:hypothetical protein